MAKDPVLQRAMFQKQGVTPAVGLGTGIGGITTPDQNAQALRSMFQPTVSIGGPTDMLQQGQPVQSFQEGGIVARYNFREPRNYQNPASYAERSALLEAARRQAIDDADGRGVERPQAGIGTKIGAAALDLATLPYQFGAGFFGAKPTSLTPFYDEFVRRPRGETGTAPPSPVQKAGAATGDVLASPVVAAQKVGSLIDPSEIPAPESYTPRFDVLRRGEAEAARGQGIEATVRRQAVDDADERSRPPRNTVTPPAPPPVPEEKPPVPERQKGSLELTLDGIRAERAEDKRQNALLSLMQAGLAIAGGRSPNAISNIGAGGQAGIAAFAAMERASREDAAARSREAIQLDTSRQQLALAERQLTKDPESIQTFKVLGGGDVMKGFEIFNADKKLQAAVAITKDITASEEDRRAANEYIRGQLTKARTGGGSFSGFSATPVR